MALGMTSRDAVAAREETIGAAQSLLARLATDLRETGMMRSTALEQTHAVQAGADRTLANINAALGEPAPTPAPGQQPMATQTGLSPNVLAQAREAVTGASNVVQKIDSVLPENAMDSKWRDAVGAPGTRPKGAGTER